MRFETNTQQCLIGKFSGNFHGLTKNDVLPVQVVAFCASNEELATIRVRSRIGHRQGADRRMAHGEVLVIERTRLTTVNACFASAVPFHEVAALRAELFDNPVKLGVFVTHRHATSRFVLASAELPEVLSCLRYNVSVQFHHDTANFLNGGDNR